MRALVLLAALAACGGATAPAGDDDAPPAPDAGPGDGGFVPEPIPDVAEEPPPPCPDQTPPDYFQFLDDTCGAKRTPSAADRELACPTIDAPDPAYRTSAEPIVVDDTALAGLVPDGMDLVVVVIHRVDGVPHYRYLSNGTADHAVQPWSSTKFLAAANAGAYLRIASRGAVGLTASVDGRALGDLVSAMEHYDETPYTSNALGRYFHDIGGRDRADALIHDGWLGRPAEETFGGNYGDASPPLGFTFTEPGGASVTIEPDLTTAPENHLSMLTLAEAVRRLVLHREEPAQQLPALTWPDVRVLLYGAEGSSTYGDFGGMSADTAIYLQGHDMDYLERRSHGRWRTFSKLGLGTAGQFVDVGYACYPSLDDAGRPVPDAGVEVVLAAHLPVGGATWAERDRILARTYRAILIRLVDGRL